MDLVDQIPVGIGHLGKTLVAQDAGVVDDNVHATEVVHGALDDLVTVNHAVRVGDGSAASGLISSTTFSAASLLAPSPWVLPPRSLTTTLAPCLANSRACARPMPPPAPVTITTLS